MMEEDRLRPEAIPNARCPAAGSLEKALKNARAVLCLEFLGIPEYVYLPSGKRTCVSLRTSWDGWIKLCLERYSRHSRVGSRLRLALKSTKRIFDAPCKECDRGLASKAKSEWKRHVARDVPLTNLPSAGDLEELRKAVRENLSGWGRRLEVARKAGEREPVLGEYIPDQQGCYELTTRDGGTLAVGPADYSGDWSAVRLGCAKTKGKFRTVTMQSAEVKRVLTPVHNALYDHITSFGWCVRGDVTKRDFEVIVDDLREGELYISGDYSAATDNIYLPVVRVIVDEISRCPELSEMERSVLLGSFDDLRYKNGSCGIEEHYPIKRGSMMGNLVSFPLLCLLNKSCFDIACDIRNEGDRTRKGRFNGDDCAFCGDADFYQVWRSVTSRYGLIVNEEKTDRSRRWIDLNSQSYDARGHRMVAKATLGFLRPNRSEPGDMLAEVVRGLVGFSQRNVLRVIIMLRHEVALRGVWGSLGCLSRWLRMQLIRKRWFRDAAIVGGAPTLEKGVRRSVEVTVGRPPRGKFYDIVTAASARLQRENTERWIGKRACPLEVKLDREAFFKARRSIPAVSSCRKFEWRGLRWAFVWPRVLLRCWEDFPIFSDGTASWYEEHPFLTVRPRIVEVPRPYLHRYPPPVSLLMGADNLPRRI
jgi:hypothetical protein